MPRIFGHGGLRLVLLSLLEDGPKHGYELIVGLEDRFMGMYRPSTGTVYPRLAALEEEGLIAGSDSGGKRTYTLTDAGREELARRRAELDETVTSATSTVQAVMEDIEAEIRSTVAAVQADLEDAVAQARRHAGGVADTVAAAETITRQAWRASEDARRLAVDEARRVRRVAEDLRRQAEHEARLAARRVQQVARDAARDPERHAGGPTESGPAPIVPVERPAAPPRPDVEDLAAEVTRWAGEVVDQIRRRLPDEAQRARLRDALDHARRAFVETMATDAAAPGADQPSGGDE